MKTIKSWTILRIKNGWQIGHVGDGGPVLVEPIAADDDSGFDQIAAYLREHGYAGEGVVLGLHSSMCLPAALMPVAAASGAGRRALAYAIEEFLPLAAEEFVAAAVGSAGRSLGVALAIDRISPWIDALESRGISVQSVCPTALLAVQHGFGERSQDTSMLIAWQEGDTIDLVRLEHGEPVRWYFIAADGASLQRALMVLNGDSSTPVAAVAMNVDASLRQAVGHRQSPMFPSEEGESLLVAALRGAAAALDGDVELWIDLRIDDLGPKDRYRPVRGSLYFAAAGALTFLVVSTAATAFRAAQYRADAHRSYHEQEQVFQAALPGQPIPRGLLSRLESEYEKLVVSRTGAPGISKRASVLPSLYQLLSALPDDLKYRLDEIRLDGNRLSLDGELLSHGDADRLASALVRQGFEVEPPHSQQAPNQTILVRLSARARPVSDEKIGKR